jgi:hypothetical protein
MSIQIKFFNFFVLILFLLCKYESIAQQKVVFKGKLESIYNNKKMYINEPNANHSIPIQADGSFYHEFMIE